MELLSVFLAASAAAGIMAPGDLPLNLVEIDGRYLVSSNSGYGEHSSSHGMKLRTQL